MSKLSYTLASLPRMHAADRGKDAKPEIVEMRPQTVCSLEVEVATDSGYLIPTCLHVNMGNNHHTIYVDQATQGEITGRIKGNQPKNLSRHSLESAIADLLERDRTVLLRHDALLLINDRDKPEALVGHPRRMSAQDAALLEALHVPGVKIETSCRGNRRG